MSAFDPSLLENKDRDQLSQIAEQLGKKPPARAKKADIVALILELAGVSPAPTDATTPANDGALPVATSADTDLSGNPGEPDTAGSPGAPEEGSKRGGGRLNSPSADHQASSEGQGEYRSSAGGSAEGVVVAPDVPGRTGAPARPRPGPPPVGNSAAPTVSPNRPPPGGAPRGPNDNANQSSPAGTSRPGPVQNRSQGDGGNQNRSQGDGGNQNRSQGENGNQNRSQGDGGNQRPPATAGAEDGDAGNRRRRRRGRGGQDQSQDDGFQGEPVDVEGLLDLREEGYGFLRLEGYLPCADDVYVSVKQVRQFALRKGDRIAGKSRPALRNEKNPALLQIDHVNGGDPEQMQRRAHFEDLTPLFPDSRLELEIPGDPGEMTARIIDLIAPIGKGQRGLIVSPPKAGKTAVMKRIAQAIETNHPEVELIVLLVDERPEEVTDMKRSLRRGEVAASTFDRPAEEHTHVAELVIERAKRLVEEGKDVVVILDGITRLARAYNLAAPPTGRIMSGGIDTGALYPPKKFFGAARNVEEGGSLTIVATALVETGSRMDEVIFEEFKGTGNMELKLDRRMADRRIFPAIDVEASSTRREELLFDATQLEQVWKLRRVLAGLKDDSGGNAAGLELLIDRMKSFRSNNAFLSEIAKARE